MKLTRLSALLTALIFVFARPVTAQEFFVDDFNDRDLRDGSPVTWSDIAGFDASSGDLVLTSGADDTIGSGVGRTYADSTITMQFRILSDFRQFGTFSRWNANEEAYYSEFRPDGRIALFKGFRMIDQFQTDIDGQSKDVWLQMTTLDDSISLKVWEDGLDEPIEPQVSIIDSSFSSGSVGLWFDPGNVTNSSVVVRSFAVSPVPEPNASTLLLGAGVALACQYRKRREVRRL